jgi:hypothetical protein
MCRDANFSSIVTDSALKRAIFDSANFSCIATDAKGVIQLFNVGADRARRYFRSAGGDRPSPGLEPRTGYADYAGLRGFGVQIFSSFVRFLPCGIDINSIGMGMHLQTFATGI